MLGERGDTRKEGPDCFPIITYTLSGPGAYRNEIINPSRDQPFRLKKKVTVFLQKKKKEENTTEYNETCDV